MAKFRGIRQTILKLSNKDVMDFLTLKMEPGWIH